MDIITQNPDGTVNVPQPAKSLIVDPAALQTQINAYNQQAANLITKAKGLQVQLDAILAQIPDALNTPQ